MIIHDSGRAAMLNYMIALYDNNLTIEIRDEIKSQINSLETCMQVLGEMMTIFRQALLDHKTTAAAAIEFVATEYEYLGMNKYLNYKYINNIVKLNLSLYGLINYTTEETYEMMREIAEFADELTDKTMKTDIYCTLIRILSRYNAVSDNIELTHKVLDYYNALPDEDRGIKILPYALVAF